jgi:CheY-like chemotaxis protein
VTAQLDLQDIAVLVVDDLEDNLDLLEQILEDEVWSVLRATNGAEAIRLAAAHQPDVLLLDLMMPGINGLAVLRTIRSMESLQETGIILQTAYTERENVITAQRMGCQHILRKPIEKPRLLAEIRACLKTRPSRRPRDEQTACEVLEPPPNPDLHAAADRAFELCRQRGLTATLRQSEILTCLQNLIAGDSQLGLRLVRIANSPYYGGRSRVRTVAQALVRIGTSAAQSLIRKASANLRPGLTPERTAAVLQLLQALDAAFPDGSPAPDQMITVARALVRRAEDPLADVASSPEPEAAITQSPGGHAR